MENNTEILRSGETVQEYMERRAKERNEKAEAERRDEEKKRIENMMGGGPSYNCMHFAPSHEMVAIREMNSRFNDMLVYMGALWEEIQQIKNKL